MLNNPCPPPSVQAKFVIIVVGFIGAVVLSFVWLVVRYAPVPNTDSSHANTKPLTIYLPDPSDSVATSVNSKFWRFRNHDPESFVHPLVYPDIAFLCRCNRLGLNRDGVHPHRRRCDTVLLEGLRKFD